MALVILCVPDGVPIVFGDDWSGAVVPFQLLAAMTVPCMLVSLMGPLTIAVGRADWELRWAVGTTIAGILGFLVGLHWGIVGVAVAYLVVVTLQIPIRLIIVGTLIPMSSRDYYLSMVPAAVSTAILSVVWIITRTALEPTLGSLASLITASTVGAVVYVVVLRAVWAETSRRQFAFFRSVVHGRL
jgi:O-antigen/teichoic acid export membrane protein